MPLPTVQATGRLTADPELRFTAQGKAVAKITVACNSRTKDQSGNWVDGDTTFLDVDLWERDAEEAAESLAKGDLVHVAGSLRQRSYEAKDGTKRIAYGLTFAKVFKSLPRIESAPRQPSDMPF